MPVFKKGFSFSYVVYALPFIGWRLPRPQNLSHLVVAVILALVVYSQVSTMIAPNYGIIFAGATLWFVPGVIRGLEAKAGRSLKHELLAWITFIFSRPKLYLGAHPARPRERRRAGKFLEAERHHAQQLDEAADGEGSSSGSGVSVAQAARRVWRALAGIGR